jgi:hypothetical protein
MLTFRGIREIPFSEVDRRDCGSLDKNIVPCLRVLTTSSDSVQLNEQIDSASLFCKQRDQIYLFGSTP